jgi:hypothetical protein
VTLAASLPRARHALSRSDGGAVFSGDIPKASHSIHADGLTPDSLWARAWARYAGVGPDPGRDHPAWTRRGRSCHCGAVSEHNLEPDFSCFNDATAEGTRVVFPGLPEPESSDRENAPFPLCTPS